MTHRWWVLHDDNLRGALTTVEDGTITADEAYALLCEHSTVDEDAPHLRVTTTPDDA
jgi:hypothetical protein